LHDDAVQEIVVDEFRRFGASVRVQAKHRTQEAGECLSFGPWEKILLVEDVVERPITQLVDVSKFT
jgi:hypothetical protein